MSRVLLLLLIIAHATALDVLGVNYSQEDKQGHFVLGAAASTIAMLVVDCIDPDAPWHIRATTGLGSAVLAGAAKEFADSFDTAHHTVDAKDFIATTSGGAVVALSFCWDF